ncbi:hypothetical protein G4B88_014783 [Cannabis sativa]|uniref:Uncharacterized protein n=1 Tax=Cannabis sativa TaxID=3483 RepID=A0A7J6I9W6_CANSA|nr:hypothetical protein G4B88_014783 [Cannabis sativa]
MFNGDLIDYYRSELISISNSESGDV